jgi:rhodanese-related sulfurtransferase
MASVGVARDVSELREALASGEASLVDVREYPEWAGGRVAGSRLVPLGEIAERAKEIDRDKPVYVICRTGRRSAEACAKLGALGFKDVRNVGGGMMAWEGAGYPVERDERAPWSLERQVRFVAGSLVLVGVLLAVFVHPYFIGLSGFVGAGLVFAAVTDTCAMGLMLARLPWNRRADCAR